MKRLLSALATLALVLGTVTNSAAEQWRPLESADGPTVAFIDSNDVLGAHSYLGIGRRVADGGGVGTSACKAPGVGACDPALHPDFIYSASIVLPICGKADQSYCIERVQINDAGSLPTTAKHVGNLDGNTWDALPKYSLPASGTGSIFEVPSTATSTETTKYLVSANVNLNYNNKTKKFEYFNFRISTSPFTTKQFANPEPEFREIPPGTALDKNVGLSGYFLEGELRNGRSGSWRSPTEKIVYEDFAPNTKVGIDLRLPSEAYGWFSGRISDPNMSLVPISKTVNRLSVSGTALEVHRLSVNVPSGKLTPLMRRYGMAGYGKGTTFVETGDAVTFNWLDDLKAYSGDRNSGSTTDWNLRSTQVNSKCFPRNKVDGLVSSNAVAFSWDAPEFIKGYLQYKVAGVHYTKDGQKARGVYDMVIRTSILRCLYNIPTVPISVSVSVVDSKTGAPDIAVTSVTSSGEWTKIRASNFTFSNKTLKVKVTKKKK